VFLSAVAISTLVQLITKEQWLTYSYPNLPYCKAREGRSSDPTLPHSQPPCYQYLLQQQRVHSRLGSWRQLLHTAAARAASLPLDNI
jgi:hypothetical protein